MEEVVGSIPTRSTKFSSTRKYPAFQFVSFWQQNARLGRDLFLSKGKLEA